MEKVKVTAKQAKTIGFFKKAFKEQMGDMSYDQFFMAVRDGYEVEPEFKENDWLNYLTIHGDLITDKVIDVSDDRVLMKLSNSWVHFDNVKSHATPPEIKQEKERRFWSGLGREVNEFKSRDIIKNSFGNVIELTDFSFKERVDWSSIKLICPAENRLDVKTNE